MKLEVTITGNGYLVRIVGVEEKHDGWVLEEADLEYHFHSKERSKDMVLKIGEPDD